MYLERRTHSLTKVSIAPFPDVPGLVHAASCVLLICIHVRNNPVNLIDPSGHCYRTPEGDQICPDKATDTSSIQDQDETKLPTELSPSEEILEYLTLFEGIEHTLHNDPADNCGIGKGHLVHLGPCSFSPTLYGGAEKDFLMNPDPYDEDTPFVSVFLTDEEIEALFLQDVENIGVFWVREFITVELTQAQFDALVSLAYNIPDALTVVAPAVNAGDFERATELIRNFGSSQFDEYPGLKTRREFEANLFLYGYPE